MKRKPEKCVDFTEWQAQVLLFFREAPIALAIKTQAEVNGAVESRRITERYDKPGA